MRVISGGASVITVILVHVIAAGCNGVKRTPVALATKVTTDTKQK